LMPREAETDRIDAVADVREKVTEAQFSRRLRIADVKLREKDLNLKDEDLKEKRASRNLK